MVGAALLAQSASASLPGRNGKLGFVGATRGKHDLIYALYTINPDGTGLKRVTTQVGGNVDLSRPSWSPDGKQIAYTSRGFVWTMRADGTQAKRLNVTARWEDLGGTGDSVLYAETPVWTADGRRIAFTYGGNERHENAGIGIFTVAATGGQAKKIYDYSDTSITLTGNVDWSAQNRLVFGGYVVGDELDEIFVRPASGGKARLITHPSAEPGDFDPSWAPDGKRIAFDRSAGTSDPWQILIVDPTGANRQTLAVPPGVRPDSPAWSPDGRFIAYAGVGTRKIHVADIAAGTEQVLTVPGVVSVGDVTWQPVSSR
jgi:Tol biopolymer transport system component